MASQELSITMSSYYYMGLMNILELLVKRIAIIKGTYSIYVPALKVSWIEPWNDTLVPIFLRFGVSKMMSSAMPDKPSTQGDGNCLPWSMSKSQGDIQNMYYALNDTSLEFNPDEPIDATLDKIYLQDPSIYQLRFLRCQSMMTSYEIIHEIENTIYVIILSIYLLYKKDDSLARSPGQISTISGEAMNKPCLFDINGLGSVPVVWDTIENILTHYFSKKYLDNDIFRHDIDPLIHSTIVLTGTVEGYVEDDDIEIDIELTGKKIVACVSLHISGVNAGGEPIENNFLIDNNPSTPVEDRATINSTTITIPASFLTEYKVSDDEESSNIDWEVTNFYITM